MSQEWTAADVPGQAGRIAVVTGANSGTGFEAARVLAGRGATVLLACRDMARANDAVARITGQVPPADLRVLHLDLASLASVRQAAAEIRASHDRLDLLINNAGVMMPPYTRTADGFELQFATNHLGHFALTGLLADLLLPVPGSRIVTMSSLTHRRARMNFADLQAGQGYRASTAYGQSKLANLLFSYELQRRLAAAGAPTVALAAHPGYAKTSLDRHLPGWMRAGAAMVPFQGAAAGALPLLRAATDPAARGGEYYGPAGLFALAGPPRPGASSARSRDQDAQRLLWQESERLTGVSYPV